MKTNIALVTGGYSGEYNISVKSAESVAKYINRDIYNVYPVMITKNKWFCSIEGRDIEIDKQDFSIMIEGEKVSFDAACILVHGTPGEDGKLQGYFDLMGITYTTCNTVTSALTFNKYFSNNLVRSFGVKTADIYYLQNKELYNAEKVIGSVGFPCFVKPNNGGSSIGITRVKMENELKAAVDIAAKEDELGEVVIEKEIRGTEITCGMLISKEEVIQFPVTEIVSKKEFFDFEAKYNDDLNEEIVPARIPEEHHNECKRISEYLYKELNCSGIVRFDYILADDGIYFLEVNTVPGMTDESIVPKMIRASNRDYAALINLLIEDALSRK